MITKRKAQRMAEAWNRRAIRLLDIRDRSDWLGMHSPDEFRHVEAEVDKALAQRDMWQALAHGPRLARWMWSE